jgi:hypothetical protein
MVEASSFPTTRSYRRRSSSKGRWLASKIFASRKFRKLKASQWFEPGPDCIPQVPRLRVRRYLDLEDLPRFLFDRTAVTGRPVPATSLRRHRPGHKRYACHCLMLSAFHKHSKKNASSTRIGSPAVSAKTASSDLSQATGFNHSASGSTTIPCFSRIPQILSRNFMRT